MAYGYTYLGNHVTNNQAELTGLNGGLHYIYHHFPIQEVSLHIVGDSQLVTGFLSGDKRCRAKRIQVHLRHITNLLMQAGTFKVHHLLRSGNTAADHLANLAMDTRLSSTNTQQADHQHLYDLVTHDLAQPFLIAPRENLATLLRTRLTKLVHATQVDYVESIPELCRNTPNGARCWKPP
jgi:ribonuclease HI